MAKGSNGLIGRTSNAYKDRTGEKYGLLTAKQVVGYTDNKTYQEEIWLCLCDCGREHQVRSSAMSKIRSCGCLRRKAGLGQTPTNIGNFSNIFHTYKGNARKRGLFWDLSDAQALRLCLGRCQYCGVEPGTVKDPGFNGIDRVDNSGGYTTENTVSCCQHCNFAKRDLSVAEFLAWAARLAAHQQIKK